MVNCSELPGGAWVQDAQIMIENTWVSKVYKAIHIKSFGLRKLTPDTEPTHCFVARSFENKMLLVHPDGEIDLGDGWDFCEEAVHVLDDGCLILHNMGTKVLFDPLNPGWGPYTGIHLAQSVQYWSKPSVGDRTLDYLVVLGQGTYKQHEVRIHMLGIPRGHFSVNEPLFGATDMLIVGDVILTQTKNRLGQRVLHWNRDWWYPSPALSGNLPLHGDFGRLKQVGPHKVMSWKCEGNNFAVIIYDTQSKAFRF